MMLLTCPKPTRSFIIVPSSVAPKTDSSAIPADPSHQVFKGDFLGLDLLSAYMRSGTPVGFCLYHFKPERDKI